MSDFEFDELMDEHFTTLLSDGSERELIPGGKHQKVTRANLPNFIECVINTRISES